MNIWTPLLILCLILPGCASKFESALDEVRTAEEAGRRFGQPTRVYELDDGGKRYEWTLQTASYGSTRRNEPSTWVSVGTWGGGVGLGLSSLLSPRGGSAGDSFCHLEIITNQSGMVTHRRWQGDGCDKLLRGRHAIPE